MCQYTSDGAYNGTAPSNGYQEYPQDLKDAIVKFEKLYSKDLSGGTADGTLEKETALISAFTALKGAVTTDLADTDNTDFTGTGGIDECIETLRSAYNTLDQYSEDLYKVYFDLVATADTPTALAVADSMTAFKTALGTGTGSYMAVVDGWKTNVDELIAAVEAYKTAKTKSVSSDEIAGDKLKDFVDAVDTYNTNVEGDGELMKTFLGATPGAGQTLYDFYKAFFDLNEKNHNGQMDYNGEADDTKPSGKKFQADLRADGGNADYYIKDAIGQTFTGFDEDDSSTWTAAQTLANTIVGYGLNKPEVTENNFHIHLDGNDSTLANLKATTTAQYNAWQKLLKNPAVTHANTNVKIYVNLDDAYANNWEIVLGADDLNNVLTPATDRQAVDFYYKKILEGDQTSEKLIDSVTLDESMQNVFKNLTFDLDIGLDFAQIIYNEDQKTVDTTAVNGNAGFVLKPTLGGDKSVTAPVSWAKETAADKVYKVGEDVVGKPTALGTPHAMKANADDADNTNYGYQLTYMGGTYYGQAVTGDFFKDNSGVAGDKVTVTES